MIMSIALKSIQIFITSLFVGICERLYNKGRRRGVQAGPHSQLSLDGNIY